MIDLKQFMEKTGVTKKKYVDEWIDLDLIPGAKRENQEYSFPDSARRPYRDRQLKAGISADKLRAHIVKAAIKRQHITHTSCFMSFGEFQTMIDNLVAANLIAKRKEDDITYYDSTTKSDEYGNKSLKEIGKYVQACLGVIAEKGAKGATEAIISKVMSTPKAY